MYFKMFTKIFEKDDKKKNKTQINHFSKTKIQLNYANFTLKI
jgi:hypothetical protein